MPNDPQHPHDEWVSDGIRITMDTDCNCAAGEGQAECLRLCNEAFDAKVAEAKGVLPPNA